MGFEPMTTSVILVWMLYQLSALKACWKQVKCKFNLHAYLLYEESEMCMWYIDHIHALQIQKVTWPDNSFWSIVFLFLQGSLRDRWYWCLFLRSLLDAPQAWRIWHRLTNFWSDNKWNCWKVIIASYWWCAECLQILEKLNKYCEIPWIVPPVGSAPPPPKKIYWQWYVLKLSYTVEPHVSDHPWCQAWVVAYGRWSLTGSFTNSNLTDGGTYRDFGQVVA